MPLPFPFAGITSRVMQQQHGARIFLFDYARDNAISGYTRLPVPGVYGFANGNITLFSAFSYRDNFSECLRFSVSVKGRSE